MGGHSSFLAWPEVPQQRPEQLCSVSDCQQEPHHQRNHTTSRAPLGLGLGDGEEIDNLEKSFKLAIFIFSSIIKENTHGLDTAGS